MSAAGAALIALLLAIAALHLCWGFGGLWPGHDPNSLREMVVGTTHGTMPPRLGPLSGVWSAAIVAGLLASAAAIVAARHSALMGGPARWLILAGYAILILVFAVRGLTPYVSSVFEYARGTPFFELNRLYYAPLCLVIAAAFAADLPGVALGAKS